MLANRLTQLFASSPSRVARRSVLRAGLGALLTLGAAGALPALAADEPINEAEILGEAYIDTGMEFVKFKLDGKEWENHEYIKGAKTLVIRGIERDSDHQVELTPRAEGFEPAAITLKSADFKRTVVKTKGRTKTLAFRASYKVSFTKTPAPAK